MRKSKRFKSLPTATGAGPRNATTAFAAKDRGPSFAFMVD
jgi:hypothetical protein